jgi:hypothetical protein
MAGIFDIQKHVRELKIVPNPQNPKTPKPQNPL